MALSYAYFHLQVYCLKLFPVGSSILQIYTERNKQLASVDFIVYTYKEQCDQKSFNKQVHT